MYKQSVQRGLVLLTCSFLSSFSFAQTNFTDKVTEWKKLFPKEDAVAYSLKETVDFFLNLAPKPGENKVTAVVTNEVIVVPLKDFLKYEDAVF